MSIKRHHQLVFSMRMTLACDRLSPKDSCESAGVQTEHLCPAASLETKCPGQVGGVRRVCEKLDQRCLQREGLGV